MIMYRQNDYWDINFGAINDEIYSHYVIMMFYQHINSFLSTMHQAILHN